MHELALDSMPGRPNKYKGEETKPVTVRTPMSVKAYLETKSTSAGLAAYDVVLFEKELTELLGEDDERGLEDVTRDLRVYAADHGLSYENNRAEVLAKLVRAGLICEAKKSKK